MIDYVSYLLAKLKVAGMEYRAVPPSKYYTIDLNVCFEVQKFWKP